MIDDRIGVKGISRIKRKIEHTLDLTKTQPMITWERWSDEAEFEAK
jgi:hypothetical protein